jgi:eukaryotic-like serine/threonine-protein kinase
VLEYLQGVTLRREIRNRGTIPPGEASSLLEKIFQGIEAAHRRHIIHRDLKPENIFLVRDSADAQPVAKILDFGLAVVRDLEFSGQSKLTQPGAAIGTVGYMSREQFLGEAVDERTDIFSLGIVAFEMLTGEVRLRGPWFSRAANVVPERLQGADAPPVHHQVAAVLLRALAEDQHERYASVQEFREALLPLLDACPPFYSRAIAVDVDASETADGWNPTL